MTSPLNALLTGRGAKEVRVEWGSYRNIAHAYQRFIYTADVSSLMFKTLCGRALRPKGGETVLLDEPPSGACYLCASNAPRKGA